MILRERVDARFLLMGVQHHLTTCAVTLSPAGGFFACTGANPYFEIMCDSGTIGMGPFRLGDAAGSAYAVDASSGKLLWRTDPDAIQFVEHELSTVAPTEGKLL